MLLGLRGAGSPNSTGEIQPCSKPSSVLKGQPYFHNSSPMANSKSVHGIWMLSNEKEREIKSSTCTRHHYDKLFIGGLDRKRELVICFMFYKLVLSKFQSCKKR